LYDENGFKVVAEYGYVKDIDLTISAEDKQISIRLHKDQAYALLKELKDQIE
jgi:hypothetical protein